MQANKESIDAIIAKLLAAGGSPPPPPPPLNSGGGGGTSGGMEARVAVLEAHVEHIRGDLAKLAGVPVDVATIKERVTNLPTKQDLTDLKGQISNSVRNWLAIAIAVIGAGAGLAKVFLG